MREIKFRAWNGYAKEMIKYDLYDYLTIDNSGALIPDCIVEPIIPMQFTGLKDKNGVEIYEGDIVQIVCEMLLRDNEIEAFRSQVAFYDGGFCYIDKKDGYEYPLSGVASENGREHQGSHFCEVIGNIYEHSELLQ